MVAFNGLGFPRWETLPELWDDFLIAVEAHSLFVCFEPNFHHGDLAVGQRMILWGFPVSQSLPDGLYFLGQKKCLSAVC